MAFCAAKDSKVKINAIEFGTGGTTNTLRTHTLNRDKDLIDITAMGDDDRAFIEGLRNATISISGVWDPTATNGPDAALNTIFTSTTTVSWIFNPTGVTTFAAGSPGYTASVWCRSYSIDTPYEDAVAWSAELQVDGAITRDTSGTY